MEIERKFLIDALPEDIDKYNYHDIEQAYLNRAPVVRIRKQDDEYYLTYKGKGSMIREEYNLPLNKASYEHLLTKADGIVITKRRYLIPLDEKHTIELDEFHGIYEGLLLAEVEFESKEDAEGFEPPAWFGKDVTFSPMYHNSVMSNTKSV
ncbi:MAG: CYTH domain-containing protein [Lachnospiraceae bacterium]|nr:CYTH domain-containing protein [Lachnospiraceae bacterium]